MKNIDFCNNCGKSGHSYNQCKLPITSFGVIVYRNKPLSNNNNANTNQNTNTVEVLMIRRKDSLGYVEFVRGKYPLMNRGYILNILNEMTLSEREKIRTLSFDELWSDLWSGNVGFQYRSEEKSSREKYETLKCGVVFGKEREKYTLDELLDEATSQWKETEWGFPKGRRNYQEKDMSCALREFEEESGYPRNKVAIVQNILPFDELFTGSNYKCYKHRYYLGCMKFDDTITNGGINFQKNEVSKCEWIPINECRNKIRPYNRERIDIINSVERLFSDFVIYSEE